MQADEVSLLKKYFDKDSNIFEYGSGFSTKWFAENCKRVVSVEHDAGWYEKVKGEISSYANSEIYFAPPTPEWLSATDGTLEEFENYVKILETIDFKPDLILVDGRARVDCCHFIARKLPNALIAFHDYQSRSNDGFHNYSMCLSSVDIIDKIGDIAIMRSKFHD